MPKQLQNHLNQLPIASGVYLMKGKGGEILYIGKALSLRKRVLSYFRPEIQGRSPKITVLVTKIVKVDVIETPTEADALLLEASLIKKYKPKYNTELRDDKSFPLIKITNEKFPRIHLTRNKTDKRAIYYGPYTDGKLLREVIRIINNLFPIRKCTTLPKTACLYYHIGQCLAPCIKPEVKPVHDRHMTEIKNFLRGGKKSLIDYLTDRMHSARKSYQFEDAQFFKDQIEALGWIRKKRFDAKRPEGSIGLSGTMELKKTFHLEKLPEKIVCFDVSNIQGDKAVASRVSFHRELENKMEYRRYKIKSVKGINDYAMIQEALSRMLIGIREGREESIPDLILIDGGKGHLNAAKEILRQEKFDDIALLSIAKQFEFLFTPSNPNPVVLPPESPARRLLQRIRDEAHRFAITYHRSLKGKDLTKSVLDEIPGIGDKRKRSLLKHFESIEAIQNAPLDQLAEVVESAVLARDISRFFKSRSV